MADSLPLGERSTSGLLISQRYRLLATIGQGGMGRVSKAMDRLTGQVVALSRS